MEGNSSIFYINSGNRLSGTTDNFSYRIQTPEGNAYNRVAIIQCNIPISYYLVQNGFNTFTLREGISTATVTITPANYTALSFINIVVPLLNSASPNGFTYNMTLPNSYLAPSTGKYTITVTGNGLVQPSFIFTDNVNELFGFSPYTTNTFVSSILTSTNVIKFIPEDTLFIHSDIVDNGNQTSILQEIFHNNNTPYSNIVYQCNDIECNSRKLRTNKSNTYNFSISNEIGRPIDLNGLNLVFTLVLFKQNDFGEMFKKYIKYNLLTQN